MDEITAVQLTCSGDIPEQWPRRPGRASARTGLVVVWILKKRRVQIPGVSLQSCHEPLLLTQRLPLAHKDLVFLALRAGPERFRYVPAKQPTDQTSHSGIA
jgi:hypothetical protein